MFKIKNLFTEHPNSVNETYIKHFKCASYYGIKMIIGGACCLIHSILPFLFKTTASSINKQIYQDLNRRHDCQKAKLDS